MNEETRQTHVGSGVTFEVGKGVTFEVGFNVGEFVKPVGGFQVPS